MQDLQDAITVVQQTLAEADTQRQMFEDVLNTISDKIDDLENQKDELERYLDELTEKIDAVKELTKKISLQSIPTVPDTLSNKFAFPSKAAPYAFVSGSNDKNAYQNIHRWFREIREIITDIENQGIDNFQFLTCLSDAVTSLTNKATNKEELFTNATEALKSAKALKDKEPYTTDSETENLVDELITKIRKIKELAPKLK